MPIPNTETQLVLERMEHALFVQALETLSLAFLAEDPRRKRMLDRMLAQAVHRADLRPAAHMKGILPESVDRALVQQRGRADAATALLRLAQRIERLSGARTVHSAASRTRSPAG